MSKLRRINPCTFDGLSQVETDDGDDLARLRAVEAAAIAYVKAQGAADKASVLHKAPRKEQARLAGLACEAYDALIDALPKGCLDG